MFVPMSSDPMTFREIEYAQPYSIMKRNELKLFIKIRYKAESDFVYSE